MSDLFKKEEDKQYILVDEKYVDIFQDMFEFVEQVITEWDLSLVFLQMRGVSEIESIVNSTSENIEKLKSILIRFQDLAHEDMVEKSIINHEAGEA